MMIEAGLVLARWAFFAASTACFGIALFTLYAFRASDGPHPRLDTGALMAWAAGAALLAAFAWLALIIVSFAGDDLSNFVNTAGVVLFGTGFGPVWLARLGAGLALFVAAALRARPWVLLALATVVLGSEGCIGHAADGWAHGFCQAVHVLAAGAWLGGLIGLTRVLSDCPQVLTTERLVCVLLRFSTVGVVSVAAIAATGCLNVWFVLGRLPDAPDAYDRFVLLKAGLFLAMVSVAAFNRFRLLPLLERPRTWAPEPLTWLRRAILLEQALGLSVLLAAGVLGITDPFP
jgi:putative copper resistance protein D